MAPLPYQPNLLLIKPQYLDPSGRVHENVTWWSGSVTSGYTASQLTAIVAELMLNWGNSWAKIGASDSQLTGAYIQDYTSATGQSVSYSSVVAGANSGAPLAQNTAVLISVHGATRYRGGHSRIYLGGLTGAITLDGVNVNTAFANWNTFLTDWAAVYTGMAGISTANGGPVNSVIYHGRRHGIAPYIEVMFNYTVQTKLASQRRRLRKAPHH